MKLYVKPNDVGAALTSFAKTAVPALVAIYFLKAIGDGLMFGTTINSLSDQPNLIYIHKQQTFGGADMHLEMGALETKRQFNMSHFQ